MDQGFDALWVGDCEDTTIVRVDVAAGEVAATIPLPFGALPNESSVTVGDDGVWVLSSGTEPELVRIDPAPTRTPSGCRPTTSPRSGACRSTDPIGRAATDAAGGGWGEGGGGSSG